MFDWILMPNCSHAWLSDLIGSHSAGVFHSVLWLAAVFICYKTNLGSKESSFGTHSYWLLQQDKLKTEPKWFISLFPKCQRGGWTLRAHTHTACLFSNSHTLCVQENSRTSFLCVPEDQGNTSAFCKREDRKVFIRFSIGNKNAVFWSLHFILVIISLDSPVESIFHWNPFPNWNKIISLWLTIISLKCTISSWSSYTLAKVKILCQAQEPCFPLDNIISLIKSRTVL